MVLIVIVISPFGINSMIKYLQMYSKIIDLKLSDKGRHIQALLYLSNLLDV